MGTLEQTDCPECGQIVHYQPQRWKAQVVCSNCQAAFPVEAAQPGAGVPDSSPIPSHLQAGNEPQPQSTVHSGQVSTGEPIRYQRSKIGGVVFAAMTVVVLALAAVGGIWGLAMLDNQNAEDSKNKNQSQLPDRKIKYFVAGKQRAKLGNVEVGVASVEYGPLRVKDQANIVHISSDPLIQIFVEIRSRQPNTLNYVSWYGNSFERGSDQVVAELRDQDGKVFNMPVFGDVKGIFGHISAARMEKNERIQDCIVFELPESIKITDIKELRLSLPMECFAKQGAIHFKISNELIQLVTDESGDQ